MKLIIEIKSENLFPFKKLGIIGKWIEKGFEHGQREEKITMNKVHKISWKVKT